MKCYDCPRKCGVERSSEVGFCHEGDRVRIAKIIENFKWEEPCISGEKGALAIFFSGCNLRCSFCQNYEISHIGKGDSLAPAQFRELLYSYDLTKFSSIDLITPTHFTSFLIESLSDFKSPIPIVWNSGGYENVDKIEKLADVVDVFLPDFKYFSSDLSEKLSKAKDYFDITSLAVKKMRELKPQNKFNSEGVMTEGVLIRHLVLPNYSRDSMKVLSFIKENINNPFISVMGQFTPGHGEIDRRLYPLEYKAVLAYAERIGLTSGYFQELSSADENFIPKF